MGSATYKNLGGTQSCIQSILYTWAAPAARILKRGGNIKKNFIHEFLSTPVLQWRRQNFGSGGDIQHKRTHQKLYKNFEKLIIKNLHKNLKNSPKFSKIKLYRI